MRQVFERIHREGMPMHKDQPRIVTIELHSHSYWEALFKSNAILTLEDVIHVYQTIKSNPVAHPILMDWSLIQGIEFEALEYIARNQADDRPLAIVSETGSIGEKYAHLINQLCEQSAMCLLFSTMHEARHWLVQSLQKEA